jgi:TusA-related sulfurtransferase
VLQADVAEGQRARAYARLQAEEAGDIPAQRLPDIPKPGMRSAAAPPHADTNLRLPVAPPGVDIPPFDSVFDGMGQACVELLLPMAKAVKAMQKGQVLKVVTDDVAAREDLAAWCRMTGHELITTERQASYANYFVRRGG